MSYHISRFILWLLFKIFFRYRVIGASNIPKKGPCILASNHLSFLDPAAAGLATWRKVCFLARESLFDNWLFNVWGSAVGAIPIKRGKFDLSAIRGSIDKLKKGYIVSLFPEGTRSMDGSIRDPKGGVGFLAIKAGVPIVPVFIKGSDKALPPHAVMFRLKPIEARVGKPIEPNAFFGRDGKAAYQALSEEVMNRIRELGRDEDRSS